MRISDWSSDVCSSDLVARPQARDGVREALAGQGRGSGPEGAAHQHRLSPKERRIEGADEICGETQVPRRRKLRRGEPYRQIAARSEGGRSEEHTSELQSLMRISYAVYCLKKQKLKLITTQTAYI